MYALPDDVSTTFDSQAKTSRSPATLTIVSTESLSAEQLKNTRLLAAAN